MFLEDWRENNCFVALIYWLAELVNSLFIYDWLCFLLKGGSFMSVSVIHYCYGT